MANPLADLAKWFEGLFRVIAKSFEKILKDLFSRKSFLELGQVALPILRKHILALMEDDTIANDEKRDTVFKLGIEELTTLGIAWTENRVRAAIEIILMDIKEELE